MQYDASDKVVMEYRQPGVRWNAFGGNGVKVVEGIRVNGGEGISRGEELGELPNALGTQKRWQWLGSRNERPQLVCSTGRRKRRRAGGVSWDRSCRDVNVDAKLIQGRC